MGNPTNSAFECSVKTQMWTTIAKNTTNESGSCAVLSYSRPQSYLTTMTRRVKELTTLSPSCSFHPRFRRLQTHVLTRQHATTCRIRWNWFHGSWNGQEHRKQISTCRCDSDVQTTHPVRQQSSQRTCIKHVQTTIFVSIRYRHVCISLGVAE